MRKSLIISWISACDYPLFRKWLRDYGSFFDEILIYWDVQFKHPFYWAFVQQSLSDIPNIHFLDPVPYEYGVGDWRSTATNVLVENATGDWLISIEQDWFARDWTQLLETSKKAMEYSDLFGWMNPTNNPYIHPAYFFIKRELLEKTSKDFSAHPEINGSDHFAVITYEAQRIGAKIVTQAGIGANFNFSPDADAFHLGGVNQNYLNGLNPGFQFHRPEVFFLYNGKSIQANVQQDPRFVDLMKKISNLPQNEYTTMWSQWLPFFKV